MLLCGRADDPSCPDAAHADEHDMLGSSPARDRGDKLPDDDDAAAAASASEQQPLLPRAGAGEPRGLVLACADLLHRGDLDGARRVADAVLAAADPRGEAGERLAHHFARALLALRGGDKGGHGRGGGGGGGGGEGAVGVGVGAAPSETVPSSSAYLAYIKIAPFLRFAHLTANQAILEAAASDAAGAHRRVLHIVDLDAAHGVQWPPLLQAIADRADPAVGPPPEVRLTGAGTDRDVLLRTGDRLRAFSSSLNLPFRFHPLILPCTAELAADPTAALELHPDETLAVNCVLFLHKLGGDGELAAFLRWVKSMNPAVVTIAEREGSTTRGGGDDDDVPDELPRRVAAAMDYYSSVFDALEATVPPASADRLAVEQEILSREIDAAVTGPDGGGGGGRARDFDAWASAARAAGLAPRPLSAFAASQARLLLRLHYPSEGYKVEDDDRGACFLGWQERPLMSVSSWQPQS